MVTVLPDKALAQQPLKRWLVPLLAATSTALAGPPLSIDDPGILDPGKFEIIAATTATGTPDGDTYQAPLLDISLGAIADIIQLGAVYSYVFTDPDEGTSESDEGHLELGVKWRFWNTDRLQLALSPIYAFGVSRASAEKGIGDAQDIISIPLVAEYQISDQWRLNTSTGYESVDGGEDAWSYGAALAYSLNDRWELLVELAGAADNDFENDLLDLRTGFDFALNDKLNLLFSVATGLHESANSEQLDYDIFLGLQYSP